MLSRREVLKVAGATVALGALGPLASAARKGEGVKTRPIPRTGEAIPRVGLGSWQTLDFDPGDDEAMAQRVAVLRRFLELGGTVIDSSPMYGRSEANIGRILKKLGAADDAVFRATKVWTRGRAQGVEEMKRSAELMGGQIDLMQVHNLLDWRVHLDTLRAWQAEGRIRYIGVTHYLLSELDTLESIVKTERLDFVQLPYSVVTREAEKRLLPTAADTGTAVLVMRPYEGGSLFRKVRGKPVPEWAKEIDCDSWGQLFLKWILGHPAVTAPIPATSKPKHLVDNMGAAYGRLPGEGTRARIAAALDG